MTKVFISYSRKDIEFAKRLTAEFQKSNIEFWVDWEGIPPTVDWMRQIEKGIEEADTFIFILSPDSILSKYCKVEIEHAVKNGKRFIPIVARDITAENAPPEVSHLNWIFFRETDDFDAATAKLQTAIQTDYEWVQEHSRLQVKALEWERNNKESSFLLRGKDLQDGELQLALNTSKEPHPTDLQRDFVFRSRQATDRQRRITTGISIAGIIALAALAVFGFVQAGLATANAIEAQSQAAAAKEAQANAELQKNKAEIAQAKAEAESRIANSGRLALESKSVLEKFPQRSLLLALEAVRINQDAKEPVRPDAEEALRLALERVTGIGLTGFSHEVSLVQFTQDSRWLVAGTTAVEGEIKIWNFDRLMGEPDYQPFYISFPSKFDDSAGKWSPNIYLSPKTAWLVISSQEETKLYEINSKNENREPLTFQSSIQFTDSKDDQNILEKQSDKVVLWQIDPETLGKKELASFSGSFAALSQDEKYLITDDPQKGLLLWDFSSPSVPAISLTSAHVADYKSMFIDPQNRWLILLQDAPQENIQVPAFDATGNQSGTMPWSSTNIVLIPLGEPNPLQFKIKLEIHVDANYRTPKFSPDGNIFAFSGFSSPDAYGTTSENYGFVKFQDKDYTYLISSRRNNSINELTFVNKDWVYIDSYDSSLGLTKNTLLDLRQNDLFAGIELSTPLLINNGEVTYSEDGKSLLSQNGDLIDFQQLDFNQAIVLNPAPQTSDNANQNSLSLKLNNNPQSVGLEDTVNVSALSPDKQWFAAGSRDGSLRLWNNIYPWETSNINLPNGAGYIALSNDNKWMAINNQLWLLKDGRPDSSYSFENESIPMIAVFSPDCRWLAYIQDSGATPSEGYFGPLLNVKLLDLTQVSTEGKIDTKVISKTNGTYGVIQFSADSRWLLIKDEQFFFNSGTANSFIYDLETQKNYILPYSITDFAFTQDQKHIVLIGGGFQPADGSYKLQKPEIWTLPANTGDPFAKIGEVETTDPSLISRDGRWLLSIPEQSYYGVSLPSKLRDLNCVIEKIECTPFDLPASLAAFSPDSSHLLIGYSATSDPASALSYDVWDLQNQDQNNAPDKVYSNQTSQYLPSFSAKGNLLVFGPQRPSDINPAGLFSTWGGYDSTGFNVTTFDGYGKIIFGAGGGAGYIPGSFQTDYGVEALELDDITKTPGKEPILLRGHESNISTSQISPNERYVLTYSGADRDNGGSAERLLRLWDMEKIRLDPTTKAVILPLGLGANDTIVALAFSPDSRWVYIVDGTNTLHYFPTSVEDLEEQACIAVGRNFIINEWQRFFPNTAYHKTCENLPEHPSAINQ